MKGTKSFKLLSPMATSELTVESTAVGATTMAFAGRHKGGIVHLPSGEDTPVDSGGFVVVTKPDLCPSSMHQRPQSRKLLAVISA